MYMIDLINKKKNGQSHSLEEINFIVEAINSNTIPDYQISAWTMAVYFQGMNDDEVYYLTKAILASGTSVSLDLISGFKVDKHSTGGVGDKTSLVFGPIAASLGLKVTKMSGRGLGITGGTIDKLETIPNFKTNLPLTEFIKIVNNVGMSIISQTENLVPADKKLYAIRDVSGTFDSLPLVAASVMSKKLAMGADLILLDVKCGAGAFAKDLKTAKKLSQIMIKIGKAFNKKVYVVISDMNKPLGRTIGNSLELQEVLASLNNKGPADLKELVIVLTALSLLAAKKANNISIAKQLAASAFTKTEALNIFQKFVIAQGGDWNYLENIANSNKAKYCLEIRASEEGYLDFTNNYLLGELSIILGAGRLIKTDIIDIDAGIVIHTLHGEKVKHNQLVMVLYTNKDLVEHQAFIEMANNSFNIVKKAATNNSLILEILM